MESALIPDAPYENTGGCYSGSGVVKDGMLYLIYTSVSEQLGQTQSVAISRDGVHFEKYEGNPVIRRYPDDGSEDFRDPKVTLLDGVYYMVCGSGKNGVGKILLYSSQDLLDWQYIGVLYENAACGTILECPDFFRLNGRSVLMFSKVNCSTHAVQFVVGDFDGKKLKAEVLYTPEAGPDFSAGYCGALTIPRGLRLTEKGITTFPVEKAQSYLTSEDPQVSFEGNRLCVAGFALELDKKPKEIRILRDERSLEVFLDGGVSSVTRCPD